MAEIGAQMHVEMRAMSSRFFSFLKYFTCHSGVIRAIRCNQVQSEVMHLTSEVLFTDTQRRNGHSPSEW